MKPANLKKLLSLSLGTVLAATTILPGVPARAAAPVFTDCSASQEAEITDALAHAREMAAGSATYLAAVSEAQRPYDGPYKAWFGAYDRWRYGKVLSNFEALRTALDLESVQFTCGCGAGSPADEYLLDPNKPFAITLCKAFWSAPPSGGKSRAGALLEAMARFKTVLGAEATARSQTESMTLASEEPAKAIGSASGYRYFAEEEKKAGIEHLPFALALILLVLIAARLRRGGAR